MLIIKLVCNILKMNTSIRDNIYKQLNYETIKQQ